MIRKGFKHALVRDDLWNLNVADRAKNVGKRFEKFWIRQLLRSNLPYAQRTYAKEKETQRNDVRVVEPPRKPKSPSLTLSLTRAFGGTFFVAALLKLVQDSLQFVNPLLLKLLLSYIQERDERAWLGYFYAALMFISALVQSVFLHQYFHRCFIVGMRLRTAIVSAVYRKSLCLTSAARKSSTVGEIVNLMSVDAQRFMDLTTYLNMLWSAPFQIVIALYFLWETLGPSVLAGVGVMILMIPLNAVIATKSKTYQKKQMEHKDARIKLMSEILNGIKVLKLYAWEQSFQEKVLGIRKQELDVLRKAAYLNAASSFTWVCAPFLVSLTTFATYVLSDSNNTLDAQKAFVSLSLFNILRFPLSMLPMLISSMVQASVSVKRLSNFLQLDELDPNAIEADPKPKIAIEIENSSFAWDEASGAALEDLNLVIPEGSLVAVVGQVGAGKSSLVSAMLGEMHRLKGRSAMRGSVAYVPQQAWIQNATVHDNVIFGKPVDDARYDQAISACALLPDLEILPAGDRTEIGEKGINLSGGQKQRVSLARAVYADASIYLFDDPLSAVDSHVGKHIFDKVISSESGILKHKTRVLVTHGISYLPYVDVIVVLSGGKISEIGTYKQLIEQKGAFAEFLKNYLVESTVESASGGTEEEEEEEEEQHVEWKKNKAEEVEDEDEEDGDDEEYDSTDVEVD